MSEYVSLTLPPFHFEPISVILNLDNFNYVGVKDVQVNCNGTIYTITKRRIEDFLKLLTEPKDDQ